MVKTSSHEVFIIKLTSKFNWIMLDMIYINYLIDHEFIQKLCKTWH